MPNGFAPIADFDVRVLILGTMPSVKSLDKHQYYGHPQNAFWRIIFGLWGELPPDNYEQREAFLKIKHIALWDVLMSCERQGSADTAIKQPSPNNFKQLAQLCPHLQAVFFNSKNAETFYKRLVKPDPFVLLPKFLLPSTSPARAMRFEKKMEQWLPVREFLEK